MLTINDYQEAKELLLEYLNKRSDIATCWQYGEVSQPGLSDMDLIAVPKDDVGEGIVDYLNKNNLPPLVIEVMKHANLIIVPESSAKGVFYWDNLSATDLKTNQKIEDPIQNERNRRLAMLVDWGFERMYRLLSFRQKGLENKPLVLGICKSFGYCIENYRFLCPDYKFHVFDSLKEDLLKLRNDWIGLSGAAQIPRLEQVYYNYCEFGLQFQIDLFNYVDNLEEYPDRKEIKNDVFFTFPNGMQYCFTDAIHSTFPLQEGKPVILLPKNLLAHFSLYVSPERSLSQKLKKSFDVPFQDQCKDDGEFQGEYAAFLRKRISFANDWCEFLKKNHFTFGLFKFGCYLNS